MIIQKLYLLILGFILFSTTNGQDTGIRPYIENPNYWQYNGNPILLFGGSGRDNIFQWAGDNTKLTDHLDILKSSGGNYIRCTMSSREYTPEGLRWDNLPYPYAKMDGKFDLTKWNDIYWERLFTFLLETHKREIIVQIELWDRWNEAGDSEVQTSAWFHSPYNPNNNNTYDWEDSPLLLKGRTGFYNNFHFAAVNKDSVLLPIQQHFVEKILDLVIDNGFTHVIFQVDNESGIGDESLEPDVYWANYIREYGKLRKKDHPIYVCTSRRFHTPTPYLTKNFRDWDNPEIKVPILHPAFNYCDISQNNGNSGQTHYDNLLWYRSKINEHGRRPLNNIKCYHYNWATGTNFNERTSATDEEALSKFWRSIFAGAASIRFHRNAPYVPGKFRDGFGLTFEAQVHIKSMKMLIDSINIFKMEPSNNLLSNRSDNEAYCLAESGMQYAVFFTGEGSRTVDIDIKSNRQFFSLKWLDINNNTWYDSGHVRGEKITLEPPGDETHWVAILKCAESLNGKL